MEGREHNMIEWLQKLFLGHVHRWEVREEWNVISFGRHVANTYLQECQHCGRLRRVRVDP